MRQVRLTVTPLDPSVHPFFALTTPEGPIDEAHSLYCNVADTSRPTYLFGIRGDPDRIADALADRSEVVAYDISRDTDDMCYVILQIEVNEFGRAIFDAFSRDSLTLVLPVVYTRGRATMELVGAHKALQEFVDALPSDLQVDIEAVGGFTDGDSAASVLSERQREAVEAALDLGYYQTPSRSTHADIADRLGCSPSTASEHLNRAEAKLVKTMFDR